MVLCLHLYAHVAIVIKNVVLIVTLGDAPLVGLISVALVHVLKGVKHFWPTLLRSVLCD